MMRKIVTILLVFVLTVALLPVSVFAEDDVITIGGIELKSGSYLVNTALEATDVKPDNSGYAYYENGVLTLDNFVFNDTREEGDTIVTQSSLKIVPVGENEINTEGSGILVKGENLVFEGVGSLKITSEYVGIRHASSDKDANISFIRGDYYVDSGEEALNVSAKRIFMTFDDANAYFASENWDGVLLSSYLYSELNINGGQLLAVGAESYGFTLNSWGRSVININDGSVGVMPTFAMVAIPMTEENELNINGGIFACKYCNCFVEEVHLGEEIVHTVLEEGIHYYCKGEFSLGDINADGGIDQYDYILAKRAHFNTVTLSESQMLRADVDLNGEVNQYDYILIKRHHFGTYTINADSEV